MKFYKCFFVMWWFSKKGSLIINKRYSGGWAHVEKEKRDCFCFGCLNVSLSSVSSLSLNLLDGHTIIIIIIMFWSSF